MQRMGEPVLIALGVHPDAQGDDLVADTVWVAHALPAGTYAMMTTDGTHAADLVVTDDLADGYAGAWVGSVPLMEAQHGR